jgi:ankyrin repeat protein
MALTYYDFEKLKKIIPDQGHEQWLASLQIPTDDNKWAETLLTFLERFATEKNIRINIDKLKTLFDNNKDLAYKFYVIYIQKKEHHNTAIFHRTIAESSLFNFLENSINCEAGSNERLNSIIASFLLTENNIQSVIQSFRTELVQRIFSAYAAETTPPAGMEVHFKAAFERAAKEVLNFNIHAPEENAYNTTSELIINFLQSKLPLFNHPFQLLEFIASQFHWATHVARMQEKDDFISSLKTTLDLADVSAESVFVNVVDDEETYPTALNKKYIRQLICQKLCELGVFKNEEIFDSQQYILPKPDSTNENAFSSWFEHFATEEEKRSLTPAEKSNLLIFSAKNGHKEWVTLLIDAGAEVNQADNKGKTPLMLAARNGNLDLAKILIDNGADVNQKDKDGKSALQLAMNAKQWKVAHHLTLQKHNRNWNSTVLSTITGWGFVRSLANLGYDSLRTNRTPSFTLMLMTETQRQTLYDIEEAENPKRTSHRR